jgi:hypothetical protein
MFAGSDIAENGDREEHWAEPGAAEAIFTSSGYTVSAIVPPTKKLPYH